MHTDVAGRVRNVQLPTSKPLLPLFEAIINSIHAIEDAKPQDGKIEIEVFRNTSNLFAESDRSHAEISGFLVKDNGIGFDDQNFEAFSTSDTTYKVARGGKGIGRFMWLAAFDHAVPEFDDGRDGFPEFTYAVDHQRGQRFITNRVHRTRTKYAFAYILINYFRL